MNVKCLEGYKNTQLCTSFQQLNLMYTACHGLGRKPHVKIIGSCSARHIERHIASMIYDKPGGDFSASVANSFKVSGQANTQIVHKERGLSESSLQGSDGCFF